MFYCCKNLVNLDVTNFNTKNSKSFYCMFYNCNNLKKIDVSKFNSSKCETIRCMFEFCNSITEIDMINWDMSNLKYIEHKNSNSEKPLISDEPEDITKKDEYKELLESLTGILDGNPLFYNSNGVVINTLDNGSKLTLVYNRLVNLF